MYLGRLPLLLALLLGCGDSTPPKQSQPAQSQPAQPQPEPPVPAKPVLRVGTSGDYAPFSKAGAGLDVDIAQRMAADLGYSIEWVHFAWPELKARVSANDFDVAMGGITFRADRGVIGYMTRAVASAGPCLLSRKHPDVIAVNRGGILEAWTRSNFKKAEIRTVDNTALAGLIERAEVDAIVTDSMELPQFARPGWQSHCEPQRDRKVYWVSPARAKELGPRIDGWLAAHEADVAALRGKWAGQPAQSTELQHLIDLLARRLELMPAVAAYKRAHQLPIDDPKREAVVLQQAMDSAAAAGLDRDSVRALFAEQITLAKAIQRRTPATPDSKAQPLDLDSVLRPALTELGDRILVALARSTSALPALGAEQLDLLVPLLDPAERTRLLAALRAVRKAPR